MAKKFVRGITDIKTINNQDFDTNNVNDLLSDGEHNYIHRKKKDGSEEYHNLTNNLKTIQSDDTDLVSVTNYNNTTNSATIRPKHDSQKEQLLESTDNTIVITHGENATDETTTVDVNPAKVLEHENLLGDFGILKTTSGNTSTLTIHPKLVGESYDLDDFYSGVVMGTNVINAPTPNDTYYVLAMGTSGGSRLQIAFKRTDSLNEPTKKYFRCRIIGAVWTTWREQVEDKSVLDAQLAQKQNTLTSNSSIGISGTGLMQLYSYQMSYSKPLEGTLNTYAKTVKKATQLTGEAKVEYHFTALLKDGIAGMTVDLEDDDVTYFTSILDSYGEASGGTKRAMINGLIFTLNGSQLTVSRDVSSTAYNQVVSFSDII